MVSKINKKMKPIDKIRIRTICCWAIIVICVVDLIYFGPLIIRYNLGNELFLFMYPNYVIIINIVVSIILLVGVWFYYKKQHRTIERKQTRKACNIYRNQKYYKIVPNYFVSGGYYQSGPISLLPTNVVYDDLIKKIFDVLDVSSNMNFIDMSSSDFLKGLKERSWKSLYTKNASCLIELENDTMIITPDIPSPYGRGLISDETNRIILNLKNKTNQEIFIIIDEVLTRIDDKYLK